MQKRQNLRENFKEHHKHKMFQMLKGLVEERQRSSDNPDQTKILNEFLDNDLWLGQH